MRQASAQAGSVPWLLKWYKHSNIMYCANTLSFNRSNLSTSAFELSGALGWTEPHNRNSSAMVFQIARSVSSGSTLHAAAQQQFNAGVHGP